MSELRKYLSQMLDEDEVIKAIEIHERQLAEARDAKESSDKMLEWLQDQVRPIKRQLAEAREENKILQHHMQCIARTKPNLVNPIKPYDLVERAINALHQAEQLKEKGE